jgi:hypothetical protein
LEQIAECGPHPDQRSGQREGHPIERRRRIVSTTPSQINGRAKTRRAAIRPAFSCRVISCETELKGKIQ